MRKSVWVLFLSIVAMCGHIANGEEVFCGVRIDDKSCAILNQTPNPPANVLCNQGGTCVANKCPGDNQSQVIYASSSTWSLDHTQFGSAAQNHPGNNIKITGTVVCWVSADCKCEPSTNGDGMCYVDLLSALPKTISIMEKLQTPCTGGLESP